jgi:formylglycine-generating enzyme required for sulfatase activity
MRWHLAVVFLVLNVYAQGQAAEAPGEKPGGRWAVLVGVDDYAEVRKLRFAGSDQRALAERLVASGFPQDQVFLLHDKATEKKYLPSLANIERQLDLVLALLGEGDLIIVGFSGHGVQINGKCYLCPEDTRIDKLSASSLPLDGVYDKLAKSKASLKLLLVDACRNDLLPEGQRAISLGRSVGEFSGATETPPEGILLLSSCGAGQISMEDEQFGHGVFMHYVLDGLAGQAANRDGQVTLAGLYDYASLNTKKYVARKFNGFQTPALRGDVNGPFEIGKAESAKTITNSIGMKLTLIPAGEFQMGGEESVESVVKYFNTNYGIDSKADTFKDEHPQHRVRITRTFYLGTYPVTLGEFLKFYHDANYKCEAERDGKGGWGYSGSEKTPIQRRREFLPWNTGFRQEMDHPVVNVSWNDAVAFCQWLSNKERKTYSLPTEAQWEYACRARTTTRYYSGDDAETLAEVGNVADSTAKKKFPTWTAIRANDGYVFSSPVGKFRPNAFGLYDLHGNVYQWCADWYDSDYYANSPTDDPTGPSSGSRRVSRGGCWSSDPKFCRSANRRSGTPPARYHDLGFRVSLVAEEPR